MKTVFNLMNGADTAGIGWRLARAFEDDPEWHLDTMVAARNYIDYPVDLPWNQAKLEELYDAADVVMIHHFMFAHENYDFGQGKPTILMHHGLKNGDENTFAATVAQCRDQGITQVCSTLDMAIWEPELQWVPAPYDLAWLRQIRRSYKDWASNYRSDGVLRIVHAPTNREIKGTDLLIKAVRSLIDDGHPIELRLVERKTWRDSLLEIAWADIAFDQPTLGYGCFAVECWGMGLPVIGGIADSVVRRSMQDAWGDLPFLQVAPTVGSIRAAIEILELPINYRAWAARGQAHVEKYHDAAKVVERLKPILAGAGPSKPGGAARRITLVGGEPRYPARIGPRQPKRAVPYRRVR